MRLPTLFVLVPLAVVAALLAVANRETVEFRLIPFVAGESAFTLVMPLFLLVFSGFLLGVLVGGATMALRRGRSARQKRLAAKDMAKTMALDAGKPRAEQPEP